MEQSRFRFSLVHLPPGYRVEWVEDKFRLFDPHGVRIAAYPARLSAVLRIEERAWRQVWRQLDREVRQELREVRRGRRTIPQLYRMKQYVRFVEALAAATQGIPADVPRKPTPLIARRPLRVANWGAAAALAAAGIIVFLFLPTKTPVSFESETLVRVREAVVISPPPQADRSGSSVRPLVQYAMSFGRFTSLKAAQVSAQRIRAKGYAARVVRKGTAFHVLGRTYSTRTQAEQMAQILRGIDLPATVQSIGL